MSDDLPFWKRITWVRATVLGAILLVLVGGIFAARPVYREFKRWRAHSFAAEGERFIEQNNWDQAFRKAQSAWQLSPQDVRAVRLLARVLTKFKNDQALAFLQQLVALPDATIADRYDLIRELMRREKWDAARRELAALVEKPPVAADTFQLAADFFALQNDLPQSIGYSRQAMLAAPDNATNEIVLAQRLILSNNTTNQADAEAILRRLAQSPEVVALDAIRLLAAYFPTTPADLESYITRLKEHPKRTVLHEVSAFELQLNRAPQDRERIIQAASTRLASLGEDGLVQLGRWLNRNKEYARTIQAISLTSGTKRQELFLLHVDALAALDKWAEVDAALAGLSVPIDQFIVSLYRARAAREMGRADLEALYWTAAQRKAADAPPSLLYLAEYAAKIGAQEESMKAYRRLTEHPQFARTAYVAILNHYQLTAHTRDVRQLLEEMMPRFPNETAVRNDWAYLNLLLNENMEAAQQMGAQLYKQSPEMLAHRITHALGHLRAGRAADALALIGNLKVDWSKTLPGWQAVYAAVLASNGQQEIATNLVKQIPLKQLKPEERKLIQGLL